MANENQTSETGAVVEQQKMGYFERRLSEQTPEQNVAQPVSPATEEYKPKCTPRVNDKGEPIENQVIVSVPFQGGFIKGVVLEENKDTILIQNYNNSLPISIPNNDKVYRMQPGQKFDLREFTQQIGKDGQTMWQKIDDFLKKSPQYKAGGFNQYIKENPKELANLLYGKLTAGLVKGETLVIKEHKKENGETLKVQEISNWEAKFGVKNGVNGLKMDIQFKQPELIIGIGKEHPFPNEQVSQEQVNQMMNENRSVPYVFKTKTGEDYKVFVKFDKDLNKFVTTPYSEKVHELMNKKYQEIDKTKSQAQDTPQQTQAAPQQTQATPQQAQAAPQQAQAAPQQAQAAPQQAQAAPQQKQTAAAPTKQTQTKEQKQKQEVEKPKKKIKIGR